MTLPPGVEVAWREVPAGSPRRDASRAILAELLPGATVSSRCAACGGDHGRPRVEGADAAVSVSYAPGWALVALTRNHARIGVDAVPAGAAGLERILPHCGADAIGWARVEAVLKADGRGLAVDPARVEVRVVPGGAAATSGVGTSGRPGAAGAPGAQGAPGPLGAPGLSTDGTRVAEWLAWIRDSGADGDRPPGTGAVWRGWDVQAPEGLVGAIALGPEVSVVDDPSA